MDVKGEFKLRITAAGNVAESNTFTIVDWMKEFFESCANEINNLLFSLQTLKINLSFKFF